MGISGGVLLASVLGRRGMPAPTVGAIIVVELASYYMAYAVSLAIAIAIAAAAGHAGAVVITAAIAFVAVAIGRRAQRWLAGADRAAIGDARLLARTSAWQIAIVALDGATIWTLLRAVGVHAPLAGVFASFMIASLARTISVVPAGLGVFEAVGVVTLHQLGVPPAAGLSAALLFRGVSYWLPMIPGFIASRRLR